MLPANEWWGILGGYGAAIWPVQLFFFSGGLVLTILFFRSRKALVNSLMKLYLAVSFGWISVVFFLTLGKGHPVFCDRHGGAFPRGGAAPRKWGPVCEGVVSPPVQEDVGHPKQGPRSQQPLHAPVQANVNGAGRKVHGARDKPLLNRITG
jgi:hypothetical protein